MMAVIQTHTPCTCNQRYKHIVLSAREDGLQTGVLDTLCVWESERERERASTLTENCLSTQVTEKELS